MLKSNSLSPSWMHVTFIFHSSVGLMSIRSPTLTPVNQIISLLFLHIRSDCSNWPSECSETKHMLRTYTVLQIWSTINQHANCNMAECNLLNHKGCDLFKQKVCLLYLIMDYCQYVNKSMVFKKILTMTNRHSKVL